MRWFKRKPNRSDQVLNMLLAEANEHMKSSEFRGASPFVQSFGRALSQGVPYHVEALVCADAPKDSLTAKSALVLEKWRQSGDAELRDLASLLAWLHSQAAFADADELFPESQHDYAYRTLMTISGNLFPTSDRARALCERYQDCLNGEYINLGGGLIDEGGTYLVHPDAAEITTHLWLVNETLGGPELNMKGPLDPADVFSLQRWSSLLLIAYTKAFRESARAYYEKASR